MLEHVRNHPKLFARIADWLKPGGKFFCQVFSHCSTPYFFDMDADGDNWMAKHFFTGGVVRHQAWCIAETWLPNLDALPWFVSSFSRWLDCQKSMFNCTYQDSLTIQSIIDDCLIWCLLEWTSLWKNRWMLVEKAWCAFCWNRQDSWQCHVPALEIVSLGCNGNLCLWWWKPIWNFPLSLWKEMKNSIKIGSIFNFCSRMASTGAAATRKKVLLKVIILGDSG